MKTSSNLLLVINADSKDDITLLQKARQYRAQFSLNLHILYVLPNINYLYYQIPPFSGISEAHPLIASQQARSDNAAAVLKRLAFQLNVSTERCYIRTGALGTEAEKVAKTIDAAWILGSKESWLEAFKKSSLLRILRRSGKYVRTLILGYHPRIRSVHRHVPILLR